jgi:uncharacterized protein YegL
VWLHRTPVPIEHFSWEPVRAVPEGLTELGSAIMELVGPMQELRRSGSGFAPVLVLVSDGKPTHVFGPTVEQAMRALLGEPWGAASVRMAVGIGDDADMTALSKFIAHPARKPLRAANQTELVSMIQWVSRQASRAAGSPAIQQPGTDPGRPLQSGPVWDASTV